LLARKKVVGRKLAFLAPMQDLYGGDEDRDKLHTLCIWLFQLRRNRVFYLMGIENALCYIVYTTNVSMTFLVLLYPEQVPVKQRYFVMHSEINASKPPEPEVMMKLIFDVKVTEKHTDSPIEQVLIHHLEAMPTTKPLRREGEIMITDFLVKGNKRPSLS
jgi:hypothetical protein